MMFSQLLCPPRQNIVSLVATILDQRFNLTRLVLIDWPQENTNKIKLFCQSRGIKVLPTTWENWQSQNLDDSVWLIQDHFLQTGWHAEQQAIALSLPVIAIHDDQLHVMTHIDNQNAQPLDLQDNIRLEHYFPIFDWQIVSLDRNHIPKAHELVAHEWVRRINYGGQALAEINFLANKAAGIEKSVGLSHQQNKNKALNLFIDDLVEHGLAKRDNKQLCFRDETARFFANGGWLEELIFQALVDLKKELPKLQDVARNVCIEQSIKNQRILQELDVVCLYDNQLIIIECKTINYEKRNSQRSSALKLSLSQLSSIRKTLGPPVAGLGFVSFFSISPGMKARGHQWGVEIIDGTDLLSINSQIKNILKKQI